MTGARAVLRAAGSHLYPGAKGTVSALPPDRRGPCLVEFADGAAATATLVAEDDRRVLAAAAYTTARGTRIPAKRWLIAFDGAPPAARFRILGRAG